MHVVTKRNGSLIITSDGQPIYHMPHWVRVNSRADMQWLADRFNEAGTDDIVAIMEFEARHSTKARRSKKG